MGQAQSNNNAGLVKERDQLLIENRQLIKKIKALKEKIDNNDFAKLEEKSMLKG